MWQLMYRWGWRFQRFGRWMVERADSHRLIRLRGLGFPDEEAQEIAHEIFTTMPKFMDSRS